MLSALLYTMFILVFINGVDQLCPSSSIFTLTIGLLLYLLYFCPQFTTLKTSCSYVRVKILDYLIDLDPTLTMN